MGANGFKLILSMVLILLQLPETPVSIASFTMRFSWAFLIKGNVNPVVGKVLANQVANPSAFLVLNPRIAA